jgi:hypothetical protein
MPDLPVADVDREPRQERLAKPPYRVLYDGQCEICQGCVSWLKTSTASTGQPVGPAAQRSWPALIPGSGWMIACASCTWSLLKTQSLLAGTLSLVWRVCSPPLGWLALRGSGFLFAMQAACSMDSLPGIGTPSASVAAAPVAWPNQKQCDGKPGWALSGRATHSDF